MDSGTGEAPAIDNESACRPARNDRSMKSEFAADVQSLKGRHRSESELIESNSQLAAALNEQKLELEEALNQECVAAMINESLPPEERDSLPSKSSKDSMNNKVKSLWIKSLE